MTTTILFLAGLALADDATAEEAIKRFKTAFRNPSAPARQAAVSELAREKHEKTAKHLIPLLMSDVADVRAAAATGPMTSTNRTNAAAGGSATRDR